MRTQELVPEVLDAVEDRQRFMEAGFSLHIYPLLLSRIICVIKVEMGGEGVLLALVLSSCLSLCYSDVKQLRRENDFRKLLQATAVGMSGNLKGSIMSPLIPR